MDDRKWEELSEGEFEAMLGAGLPDLPPEGIVEEVTPWKRAWNRVLVGMALSTVTLNFWLLDTILPAVGGVPHSMQSRRKTTSCRPKRGERSAAIAPAPT